ncbi:hypothetical protein LptCag_1366 [Leptospirillum ferriphilum]|uniref:Uncharacterized protein n=1 Tax=Leptospirillum ferriphilum TaxID=178606 RepID=A0A094YKB8_9BACT|nr:hypothetical protein [Leptospirillum ferriphilum]KGA93656.1 hypothetical protein LptCag_1366 [Leptospirillum ferriphilum]
MKPYGTDRCLEEPAKDAFHMRHVFTIFMLIRHDGNGWSGVFLQPVLTSWM